MKVAEVLAWMGLAVCAPVFLPLAWPQLGEWPWRGFYTCGLIVWGFGWGFVLRRRFGYLLGAPRD